jgi:hypothetical protein
MLWKKFIVFKIHCMESKRVIAGEAGFEGCEEEPGSVGS